MHLFLSRLLPWKELATERVFLVVSLSIGLALVSHISDYVLRK